MVETTGTTRGLRRPGMFTVGLVVLTLLALALSALGAAGGPPVIRLTQTDAAGTMAGAEEDAGAAPGWLPAVEHRFELGDGARFGAGEAAAWRLEPPDDLGREARMLAGRLGLDAEVVGHGDGHQVGADDGTSPRLWVGPTGDWNYHDPTLTRAASCVGQDAVEPVEPVEPDQGEGSEPSRGPVDDPGDLPDPDREPCEPQPPAGVPSAQQARAVAETVLADLGLPVTPRIDEVHADDWGAWVSASVPIDGRPSDLQFSLALGPEGAITAAHGTLGRPVEADRYPTLDAHGAVERLEGGGPAAYGAAGGAPSTGEAVTDPAVREGVGPSDGDTPVSSSDDGADTPATPPADGDDAPGSPPTGGGVDGSGPDAPDTPRPEPEIRTVTLVDAEPVLLLTIDAEQTRWLLPGVRFTDRDGGTWQVMTVPDDHLEEVDVPADGSLLPAPGPLPTEPMPEPGRVPEGEVPPDEPAGLGDAVERAAS